MKLSEAIRLGAMLKPQGFGNLYADDGASTCAMGAAIEASGVPWEPCPSKVVASTGRGRGFVAPGTKVVKLPEEWSPFLSRYYLCPACPLGGIQFGGYGLESVAHLNDAHRWSREQIAEWVEYQEEPETFPVPAQSPDTETVSPPSSPPGRKT